MPNIASKLVPTFTGPALDADRLEGQVPVTSGGTGVNSLTQLKQNLNLNNVDNTSDANKPVSTAQAAAISTALTTNLANFDEKLAETEAARDEALSFGNAKVVTYWLEADALTGLTNGAGVVVLATDTGFHPAVTGDIGVVAGQTPNSGYYKYSGGLAKLVRQGDLESTLVKSTSEQVADDATRAEAFAAAITTVLDNYVSDTIAEGLADSSIPNGTYFPVITADGRHFLVKKISSSVSGTIVEYNTVTAFEEATAIVEAARDEALGYGSSKVVASWTEASALTGLTNGYPVFVLSVDTGTHTAVSGDVDTVSGQTPNAGYYRYSTSLASLVRVANLESSLTKSYRDTTKAYLDAVSTMLNGYIFTTVAEGLASSEVPVGTFFLVVDVSNRYYAVYKDVGNVAGQTIEFATAFSGIESPRVRASYTVLAAESGWVDNQIAMVTAADTGTHASVVGDVGASGGQTPNRGHYRYSTVLGKLVRQGDLESVVSTANKNLTEAYTQTLGTMFDGYIYQTTAEGLADADVPNGTFFPVITTDNRRYDVYKVNSTTAGQTIEYPTITYLDNTHTKIADLSSTTAGKGVDLIGYKRGSNGITQTVKNKLAAVYLVTDWCAADGTTNDTTSLTTAISELPDYATLDLCGRTLLIQTSVSITGKTGIKIINGSIIRTAAGSSGVLVTALALTSCTDIEIGVKFDLNNENTISREVAVSLNACTNITFDRCRFDGCYYGVLGITAASSGVRLHKCTGTNTESVDLATYSATANANKGGAAMIYGNALINNVTVNDCDAGDGSWNHLALSGVSSGWTVKKGRIRNSGDSAVYLRGSTHTVTECEIYHAGKDGIKILDDSAGTAGYGTIVSNNHVNGAGYRRSDGGIGINVECDDKTITGNVVTMQGPTSIPTPPSGSIGGAKCIVVSGNNTVISGNTLKGDGLVAAVGEIIGIVINTSGRNSANVSISGNRINTMRHAVSVVGSATYTIRGIRICDNDATNVDGYANIADSNSNIFNVSFRGGSVDGCMTADALYLGYLTDGVTVDGFSFRNIASTKACINHRNGTVGIYRNCYWDNTGKPVAMNTGGAGQQIDNSWQRSAGAARAANNYHFVGDIVIDITAAAGASPGVQCVTAGTTGTFKAMAALAA